MKTLAIMLVLALQTTGLWSRLPDDTRTSLSVSATGNTTRTTTATPALSRAPSFQALPVRVGATSLELPGTTSVIAVDAASSTVLYEKNASEKRPLASISKLVTALVINSTHKPDEVVTIPELPVYKVEEEHLGLLKGEQYKLGDLLSAALIPSANDAADALAIIDAGSIPKFADRMNAKMKQWGIGDTQFASPSGLQDQGNYTTAASLAKIAQLALTSARIRDTVAKSELAISSTAGRAFTRPSTNKLLATGQFYGIKTGYTPAAGECFVGLTRVEGHDVITVVLGSGDRFGATQSLVNWIENNWKWL